MIEGKTSTGFSFKVDENRLNNMEFIDALADITEADRDNVGDVMVALSRLIGYLLTKDQKKALYDHCRLEDGTVPIAEVNREVLEIIAYNGERSEEVKN